MLKKYFQNLPLRNKIGVVIMLLWFFTYVQISLSDWRTECDDERIDEQEESASDRLKRLLVADKYWAQKPLCYNEVEELESLADKLPGDERYERALRAYLISEIVWIAKGWGASLDEIPQEEFKALLPQLYTKARFWRTNRPVFAINARGNIIVSSEFLSLSREYKRAILIHEIAHQLPNELRVHEKEIEADRVAVCYLRNRVGTAGQELFDALAITQPQHLDADGETHPSHRKRCEAVMGAKCGFGSVIPRAWR